MIAHIRINPDYKERLKEYEKSKLSQHESNGGLLFRILKGTAKMAWKTIFWVFNRRTRK